MRKITFEDAFVLSEILDKMNIQSDINAIFDEAKAKPGSEAQNYMGGQVVLLLMKSAHKAKKELCEWIASLSGKSVEEVKGMGLKEMSDFLKELFTQEGIGDFFKSAVVE